MILARDGRDGQVLEDKGTAGPGGHLGREEKVRSPQRANPVRSVH